MRFNRGHITTNPLGWEVDEDAIPHAHGLLNASLDDALRYGGQTVQEALSGLRLVGNRNEVVVDVKVHMLKRGMNPAIPGWHTDGVPRGDAEQGDMSASGPEAPDLSRQEDQASPHYHLFYAGCDAPTVFLENRNVVLPDHVCRPGRDLYANISKHMAANEAKSNLVRTELPANEWWTWDWWELHTGQPARQDGWRILIRVTESDWVEPEANLHKVIRTQQQAYISGNFGW